MGVRLFAAQVLAGLAAAALLRRVCRPAGPEQPLPAAGTDPLPPLRLDGVIADAALTYVKLCGFILYFRLLAGGLNAAAPELGLPAALLLEVCSGCDLASRTGRWGRVALLCRDQPAGAVGAAAGADHLPGAGVVPAAGWPPGCSICPCPLAFFRLLLWLPGGAAPAAAALHPSPVLLRRVPPDCALLAFLGCCLAVCQLSRALPGPEQKEKPRSRKNGLGAFAGATDPIRTDDLLITSELLYRLSHSSMLPGCNANYCSIKVRLCQAIPPRRGHGRYYRKSASM